MSAAQAVTVVMLRTEPPDGMFTFRSHAVLAGARRTLCGLAAAGVVPVPQQRIGCDPCGALLARLAGPRAGARRDAVERSRRPHRGPSWPDVLLEEAKHAGLAVVREHRFHPVRQWRFDVAVLDARVAVEIDGGTFVAGRHTRGIGAQGDMGKYAVAALMGWLVLRVDHHLIKRGFALRWLRLAVDQRTEQMASRAAAGAIEASWASVQRLDILGCVPPPPGAKAVRSARTR